MAGIISQTLQVFNPFPSTLNPPQTIRKPCRFQNPPPLSPRAVDGDSNPGPEEITAVSGGEDPPAAPSDSSFENRLAQVRLKYRSGTGKKAEQRRAKKSPAGKKKGGGGVLLPPVPLREPASAGGLRVDFGFCPYSERLNGRVAALGLAALLLVELGSGKGLLAYHAAPILFVQIYTVAAVSAVFVKYEKERISVWPPQKPPSSAAVAGGD